MDFDRGAWAGGLAEWIEGDVANLSVAFSWRLDDAYQQAIYLGAQGYRVRAGGPGLFTRPKYLEAVAELGGRLEGALARHNPAATMASRGCPVGCWFCVVPKMEGREFTLLPEFTPRPVLCDNNLSALPADYQDHIVGRYIAAGVPLLDANSGFEPRTFDAAVYRRWSAINRGPWRFAYDDAGDGPHVERVMRMLGGLRRNLKMVYVLIGNEPVADCLERIERVIAWGGIPHAQPFIKLNALRKAPAVRADWSRQTLIDVARWCNRKIWRRGAFDDYRRGVKTAAVDDRQLAAQF